MYSVKKNRNFVEERCRRIDDGGDSDDSVVMAIDDSDDDDSDDSGGIYIFGSSELFIELSIYNIYILYIDRSISVR